MENGLYLIGWGISPGLSTQTAREIVANADKIYLETYTVSRSEWILDELEEIAGNRVIPADRSLFEEKSNNIIEEASKYKIALVVPGDPLIATTHRSLLIAAAESHVDFQVIPGVSGVCAAKTLSWLDYYKFGRTVTIPGPWRNVRPYSIYTYVIGNLCAGLHTLVLLDINPRMGEQLDPCNGLAILMDVADEVEQEFDPSISLRSLPVIIVEKAGYSDGRTLLFENIMSVCGWSEEWREPSSLVIPGVLAGYEREALLKLTVGPYRGRLEGVGWRDQMGICRYYLNLLREY